jgi:hypothetical protein
MLSQTLSWKMGCRNKEMPVRDRREKAMGRLIDADELFKYIEIGHLRNPSELCFSENDVADLIMNAPTIDAVPAVRGKWKPVKYTAHCSCGRSYETYHYSCSACNHISYAQPYGLNYCPNCGAKMDKE